MQMILAILATSCIVVCTKAISCYQCQDVAIKYDSAAVNDIVEQNEGEGDNEEAPPKCDSSHMNACSEADVCGAMSVSYSASMFGASMTGEMVHRLCVPGYMDNEAMEQIYCTSTENTMTEENSGESGAAIDFKSCKLDVCRTDNCNTQGMDKFQDDGERENYVSSETKLTVSFLLIQLVSFLAVAIFQI